MTGQANEIPSWRQFTIGNTDWIFLVEVVFRAVVVYLLLLAAMRVMGKRLSAQLSISELAIVLSLGAVAGLPLEDPQRGILPALLILLVAVGFQRGLAYLAFKRRDVERFAYGDVRILLKDGRLQMKQLRETLLPRDKVLSTLRTEGIMQLGEVRRVFLEVSGRFSVMKYRKQRPGFPLLQDLIGSDLRVIPDFFSCATCGFTTENPDARCPACEHEGWVPAVVSTER
jgi:uncharacterized membrane protein YcaP (DUF421 family)